MQQFGWSRRFGLAAAEGQMRQLLVCALVVGLAAACGGSGKVPVDAGDAATPDGDAAADGVDAAGDVDVAADGDAAGPDLADGLDAQEIPSDRKSVV